MSARQRRADGSAGGRPAATAALACIVAVAAIAGAYAAASTPPAEGPGTRAPIAPAAVSLCALYPIGMPDTVVRHAAARDTVEIAADGGRSHGFSWLTWTGSQKRSRLITSLTVPGDSISYRDPGHRFPDLLSHGDRLQALHGVRDGIDLRRALGRLGSVDITVPLWDREERRHAGRRVYRTSGFAVVRIVDARLRGTDELTLRFVKLRYCGRIRRQIRVDVHEDAPLTATVSADDGDSGSLTFGFGLPAHGRLTRPSAVRCHPRDPKDDDERQVPPLRGTMCRATFGYRPFADWSGTDSFSYTASDGRLTSAPTSVDIVVSDINDPPTAGGDAIRVRRGGVQTLRSDDLLRNDAPGPAGEQGQRLTVSKVGATGETRGTVSLHGGSITFVAAPGFTGTDRFAYEVCDDGRSAGRDDPRCATGTVEALVEVANSAPVAAGSVLQTDEDERVVADFRAHDGEGDALTYTVLGGPDHGTLDPTGPGPAARTYTPAPDFNGTDRLTFKADDGALDSGSATVDLTVREVNDPPTAAADSKTARTGVELRFPVTDLTSNDTPGPSDEEPQRLTVSEVGATDQTHGTVALAAGEVTYSSDLGFSGPAQLTYVVCDDGSTAGAADPRCTRGSVTVHVVPVPHAPVAADLSVATDEDVPLTLELSAHDEDGDPVTYAILDGPSHGKLVPSGGGAAARTYTPDADFNGTDELRYRASDGRLESDTATVEIAVRAAQDPPLARDD